MSRKTVPSDGDHKDDLQGFVVARGTTTWSSPPQRNPMAVAKRFLEIYYPDETVNWLIRHHRATFHRYDGRSWPELEDRRLQSDLYLWLADAWYWKESGDVMKLIEWEPTKHKVADVIDAIRAHTHPGRRRSRHRPGSTATLTSTSCRSRTGCSAFAPGSSNRTRRRSSARTSCRSLSTPAAPAPRRWLRFLEELWPDDPESASTLAEIMGYILGGSTRLQKIFMLVGPLRSGKGTIGRVLTGLLGAHNVAAPTLAGMTTNFGLSPLIGKPLGLISDARLGSRADGTIAVERLLSISGEDSITIDRKYRDPWTGRLPTRFVVLTNEIPRFTDASGALASRFVMLVLTTTFYGREDPTLTDIAAYRSAGDLQLGSGRPRPADGSRVLRAARVIAGGASTASGSGLAGRCVRPRSLHGWSGA